MKPTKCRTYKWLESGQPFQPFRKKKLFDQPCGANSEGRATPCSEQQDRAESAAGMAPSLTEMQAQKVALGERTDRQ